MAFKDIKFLFFKKNVDTLVCNSCYCVWLQLHMLVLIILNDPVLLNSY